MRRTLYLHIGTEKTGTSTLQAFASLNRARLAEAGVLYPASPGERNHVLLTLYASDAEITHDLRRSVNLFAADTYARFRERFPAELKAEIDGAGCRSVWLSNEHLSSRVRRGADLARLATLLRSLADEVVVVVYLRPQVELLLSGYSTSVKSGNDEDIRPPTGDGDYYYNYDMMLDLWATAFGAENIVVRVYERGALAGGDIVRDFAGVTGFALPPGIAMPETHNPSLDSRALKFLRAFNREVPRFQDDRLNPERDDVAEALESVSTGPKLPLPAAVLHNITDIFAASNARVAKRFLGREDGRLFTTRGFEDRPEPEALTAEDAVQLAAFLWRWKQRQLNAARARIAHLERILADSGATRSADAD